MAGLGEVCTHVAAVLFYLEALHRIEEVQTCTQQQCGWIVPSASTTAQYLEVKDIDFSSARGKKRKLDEMLEGSEDNSEVAVSKSGTPPTDTEMNNFLLISVCVIQSQQFCHWYHHIQIHMCQRYHFQLFPNQ